MRLEHLMVMNYKSIHHAEVDFGGLTCLVGPNNSGKSNLLDALAFLRDVAVTQHLDTAVGLHGGSHLRYFGAPANEPTMVELTAVATEETDGAPSGSKFRYSLRLAPDLTNVETEQFKRYTGGETHHLYTTNWVEHRAWQIEAGGEKFAYGGNPLSALFFEQEWGKVPGRAQFKKFLKSFQFYRFMPDHLKRQGPARRVNRLDRDGANFAGYFHTVQSHYRPSYGRIEEELRKNFPHIAELATDLTEDGQVEVSIREKWFKTHSSGRHLSDGLVGFLAHLVALYGPDEPAVVAFEEPENYIHPLLMERLVDMLKGASESQQVILSSHSIPLINRLELANLLIVERGQDGGTTTRRVEAKADLLAALKEWALGEAYASGVLDAA